MVTVTIDDKKIEVAEGTTVLRAAESAGIKIPTLCDHSSLAPYGGCRLCLVEVDGMRTLQPSCTLPVSPNMVVHTATPKVKEARKFVLTLLFSERNHFCMYCQVSNGDCELQNSAYAEDMTHWPLQPNWTPYPIDASHPYFVLDNNRCILCRRCVRACAESVGNFTLGIEERGSSSVLVADLGNPLGESTCISCGTCVQICPTGALIDRQSAYLGRAKDSIKTKSICTACSIGCAIDVVHRDNTVSRIEGDWDAPINSGLLCEFGRFAPIADMKPRLVTPLVKKGDSLKAATMKEASDAVTAGLKGANVAALISPSLPAETMHAFKQVFADASALFDCDSTSFLKGYQAAGKKVVESDLAALNDADCVVAIGADLVSEHQVAGFMVKRGLPTGVSLVCVDDKPNKLAEYADTCIDPAGKLAEAIAKVKALPAVQNAAKVCVVLGSGSFLTAESVKSVVDLVDELQESGKSAGLMSLKGAANSYTAYLYDMDSRVDLKKASAAVVVLGEEEPSQKLVKELEGVPFVVVVAAYSSALTARANVVLPAPIWSEMEGHYLNLEGKLQSTTLVVQKPEGIPAYHDLMQTFATAAGVSLKDGWKTALSDNMLVTEPVVA